MGSLGSGFASTLPPAGSRGHEIGVSLLPVFFLLFFPAKISLETPGAAEASRVEHSGWAGEGESLWLCFSSSWQWQEGQCQLSLALPTLLSLLPDKQLPSLYCQGSSESPNLWVGVNLDGFVGTGSNGFSSHG